GLHCHGSDYPMCCSTILLCQNYCKTTQRPRRWLKQHGKRLAIRHMPPTLSIGFSIYTVNFGVTLPTWPLRLSCAKRERHEPKEKFVERIVEDSCSRLICSTAICLRWAR